MKITEKVKQICSYDKYMQNYVISYIAIIMILYKFSLYIIRIIYIRVNIRCKRIQCYSNKKNQFIIISKSFFYLRDYAFYSF